MRYILVDESLKDWLNDFYFQGIEPNTIVRVPQQVFEEYKAVIRFRDTLLYEPQIKAALRKIQEGITELIAYRLLSGQDPYIVREDFLEKAE